jgi:cysteinyl-tRNA synthetase
MHTGFLNVKGEKMSKSLGNFITIREMLRRYDAESFRFFVLSAHYRSPIDFSESALEQSRKSLERIRQLARTIDEQIGEDEEKALQSLEMTLMSASVGKAKDRFIEHMDNDFNTPYASASFLRW